MALGIMIGGEAFRRKEVFWEVTCTNVGIVFFSQASSGVDGVEAWWLSYTEYACVFSSVSGISIFDEARLSALTRS